MPKISTSTSIIVPAGQRLMIQGIGAQATATVNPGSLGQIYDVSANGQDFFGPFDRATTVQIHIGEGSVFYETYADISPIDSVEPYRAPYPSADDTTTLQAFIDQASKKATLSGCVQNLKFPPNQTYQVTGLFLRSNLDIDFNGSRFIKTANFSGDMFTSNTVSVFRTGPWVKNGNSWYGNADNISLRNVILDANNKDNLAVLELHGVRNFFAEGLTLITSQWSRNWGLRGGGFGRMINSRILGQAGLYQDGPHWQYGGMILDNWDIESGDDGIAAGDDAGTANVMMDDVHLEYFIATNIRVKAVRGAGCKVYTAATKPYSGAPNNYANTGKVRNIFMHITGQSGLLRNGGVSVFSHKPANSRTPDDLRGIHIHTNLKVGTAGDAVWDAVSGVLVGNPTAVSAANPVVVTLAAHGLTAGKVVHLMPDIGGMRALNGFYQVMATNLAAGSFQISDTAYRNNVALNGTSPQLTAWTTGKLIAVGSGTGYTVGDELTLAGGTYVRPAKYLVTQVNDVTGAVEAIRRLDEGSYSVLPATPNTPTGGTGTGCTLHLYLQHDGVNAYGIKCYAGKDVTFTGVIDINDTTHANATRFQTFQVVDTESADIQTTFPRVPANGGQVSNESSVQLSRKVKLRSKMTCNGALAANTPVVSVANSADTLISGVSIENLPSNTTGVLFPIGGNIIQNRPIVSINGASNSSFEISHGDWRAGDIVRITGNVLSAGSLDGYYVIRLAYDASFLSLRTLAGAQVGLGAATVTTLGTMELANNTIKIENTTISPAQNATGTIGINSSSTSPHRVAALTIADCTLWGMGTPIGTNVTSAPAGYVARDNKT